MLRHAHQSGIVTVLNSASSHPLQLWRVSAGAGGRVCVEDDEGGEVVDGPVVRIEGPRLAQTFVGCPRGADETLGIRHPFLVLVVKDIGHQFSVEAEIADTRGVVRRLRASNFEPEVRVEPGVARLPLRLDPGWNYLTFDLAQTTARAYGTGFAEARRVTVHASACLRLVLFADRVVPEDELPRELRLRGRAVAGGGTC
ncbi:hypothetical protein H4R18_003720 [Coemansia javaensis]|uniref:CFA20 domain-containing protein n=1 Tax=Coemansia javaensis TaxID=2761396 RepID=A0A9W8HBC8_9FUNG|nr:hypothetical protein H4R18_003720 [Coemansia javaensis]